jgi:hypothetical protein
VETTPHPFVMPVRPAAGFVLAFALAALLAGAPGIDAARAALGRLAGETSLVCAFRARTGADCLGCGGTRAFGHVARGRLAPAFEINTLGAAVGLLTWAAGAAALGSLWTGRGRYLVLWLAALGVALPVAFAIHVIAWWRALPPGVWP